MQFPVYLNLFAHYQRTYLCMSVRLPVCPSKTPRVLTRQYTCQFHTTAAALCRCYISMECKGIKHLGISHTKLTLLDLYSFNQIKKIRCYELYVF